MKVKIYTIILVFLAIICFFGCDNSAQNPPDMVKKSCTESNPAAI